MDYNTSRTHMAMPEYGRHIHEMVDHLKTIEDKELRQKDALIIIEIMGNLNPHLRIVEDFRHMLWDHLFVMANYDLDVDSPYPIPKIEDAHKHPQRLPYPGRPTKHRHLGANLAAIIQKALAETDEEKKRGFINTIAYYMKLSYSNWHNEPVADNIIREELSEITHGALNYVEGDVRIPVNSSRRTHTTSRRTGGNSRNNNNNHKSGGNRNYRKGNNNYKSKRR